MSISDVISLLSGISMFLFGMSLMGEALKQVSGDKLEPILYKLSGSPIRGLLLGSGVTAVIQSSSATSVILVGFVSSGIMKVRQAIPVILGAIFGTSITGWIICLSYIEGTDTLSALLSTATLTGIIAVTGILLRMFSKNKVRNRVGDILLGLAILLFGMSLMSGSVVGLKEQPWFHMMLTSMKNPLLGILVGMAVAAMLQSASAAVGIVQALSITGAITFNVALPLFMGISIGASLPVMLSSLGTNTNGKRTALSYLVSCFVGVMATASIFYIIEAIVHLPFMEMSMNPFSLAFVNTVFRFVMICILMPFTKVLEAIVNYIIPAKAVEGVNPIYLDERFTRHPSLAIEQSRIVINDMARQASHAVSEASALLSHYSEEGFQRVVDLETEGDQYEDTIGSFLMKLSEEDLTERHSHESSLFLHTLSDFERISDHALNIANNAQEIHEKQLVFSDHATHELSVMKAAVREILEITIQAFLDEDMKNAERVEPLEEVIDDLCDQMKLHHVERLQTGRCSISQGFVFNDLMTNFERISDHCSNIAVALIEIYSGSFATHEYLGTIKSKRNDQFERYFDEYKARFAI